MLALGYHEYVCQGGDWGFAVRVLIMMIGPSLRNMWQVTNSIAATYGPKYAKAWHTNMPVYA